VNDTTPTNQPEPAGDARLSIRTATRLAWSLWAVCVVLIMLTLYLDFLTDEMRFQPLVRLGIGHTVLIGVPSLTYPTVGFP
jgi:hypothetical protein